MRFFSLFIGESAHTLIPHTHVELGKPINCEETNRVRCDSHLCLMCRQPRADCALAPKGCWPLPVVQVLWELYWLLHAQVGMQVSVASVRTPPNPEEFSPMGRCYFGIHECV